MKKAFIICLAFSLFIVAKVSAIKVNFFVAQHSVNIAEGTTALSTNFIIVPNTFNDSDIVNPIDLVDFLSINYNEIDKVIIEQMDLSESREQIFLRVATFQKNDTIVIGTHQFTDFKNGSIYIYRLALIQLHQFPLKQCYLHLLRPYRATSKN